MTNTQKFYNLMKRHAKFLSELSQDYHPYSDELYRVESVIDRMTPVEFPPRIEWDDSSSAKDDYHKGYMAGWNMYLAMFESQFIKAKEAKQ